MRVRLLFDLDLCDRFLLVFFQRGDSLIYESSKSSKNLNSSLAEMAKKAAVLLLRLLNHSARKAEGTAAAVALRIGFTLFLPLWLAHCSLRIQSADGLPRV